MIPSVNYNQHEILSHILNLCGLDKFDADLTYGNGNFYKNGVPEPTRKFDIDPQKDDVEVGCSTKLPLQDGELSSCVFDPPFLTYVRAGRSGNGNMAMAKRYSGYWRYDELEEHYKKTIAEAHRVLNKKGILVFKCQDIIHNHKMHPTHINVVNWSEGKFRLRDMFILAAKHRMAVPQTKGTKKKQQKHARIFHSYFLVLEKL